MKVSCTSPPAARIPAAVLAAVAFLFLPCFLLPAARETDRTKVNLPAAAAGEQDLRGAALVVLAPVVQDGRASLVYKFSNGADPSRIVAGPGEVYLAAASQIAREPAKRFVIRADRGVRFEKIDEILDALRRAQVRSVVLQAQRSAS